MLSGIGLDLVTAVETRSDPTRRDALRNHVASQIEPLVRNAAPNSDEQLQLARIYAQLSITPEQINFVRQMRDGQLPGLAVDRDLRWFFTIILTERGAISRAEIDETLASDKSFAGELSYAEALASIPDATNKAETWKQLLDTELSTSMREVTLRGFMRARHADLLAEYVDPYFDSLLTIWENPSFEVASKNVKMLYPTYIISQESLDKTDAWLNGVGKDAPVVLRRLVSEGRDSLARALRIQMKDIASA